MNPRPLTLRTPRLDDAPALHGLTRETGVLDVNSCYAYALVCDHFSATSVVAVAPDSGDLAGFVSAYRLPREPSTLFVWQVAVAESARGRGLASRMLARAVITPRAPRIRHVLTTITRDNTASIRLFEGLARAAGCGIAHPSEYPPAVLGPHPDDHAAEVHHRIGPFPCVPDDPGRTVLPAWSTAP